MEFNHFILYISNSVYDFLFSRESISVFLLYFYIFFAWGTNVQYIFDVQQQITLDVAFVTPKIQSVVSTS